MISLIGSCKVCVCVYPVGLLGGERYFFKY